MSRVSLSVDLASVPAGQRVEVMAEAIREGLKTVAADPELRLRMILGDASARYDALCHWVARSLEEDETAAPGLIAMAEKFSRNPGLFRDPREAVKAALLEQALAIRGANAG